MRSLQIVSIVFALLASGCASQHFAPAAPSQNEAVAIQRAATAYESLYAFGGGTKGFGPYFGPIAVGKLLYGTASGGAHSPQCGAGCGFVYSFDPATRAFAIEYNFNLKADGENPGGLAADTKGSLYGPAAGGTYHVGMVFKLSKQGGAWVEQTIYSFQGGSAGAAPSQFVVDAKGNIVGSATNGGGSGSTCCGIVYQLTPSGNKYTESVLHRFTIPNGVNPGVLTMGPNGTIYGTTLNGGELVNNICNVSGCGTVFALVPGANGYVFKTLYKFHGIRDGSFPSGRFAFGSSGAGSPPTIYGVTETGGNGQCQNAYGHIGGCGTVYALIPVNGAYPKATLLHQFQGTGYDGDGPEAGITLVDGKLFGTAVNSGALGQKYSEGGTVFQLAANGTNFAIVHTFPSDAKDGFFAGLSTLEPLGPGLYGATLSGGGSKTCSYGCGTLYRIVP